MTYDEFSQRFAFDPETDRLGTGGFGSVFRARDKVLHQMWALKIAPVQPDLEEFSLLRECARVQGLEHANIARYHTCYRLLQPLAGLTDVALMQYYEAGHLGQLLNAQPLRDEQKQELLLGILAGIKYLHGLQPACIIHGDLKPENILIQREGPELIPLITDFGISRSVDANKSAVPNLVKAFSLHFAAPEQEEGDMLRRNVDLWSFGALIPYVWLNGQLPFRTEGLNLTTASGTEQMRGRIRALDLVPAVATVPEPWQQLMRACLVTDPEARIRTCAQAQALLDSADATRLLNPPETSPAPIQPKEDKTKVLCGNKEPALHEEIVLPEINTQQSKGFHWWRTLQARVLKFPRAAWWGMAVLAILLVVPSSALIDLGFKLNNYSIHSLLFRLAAAKGDKQAANIIGYERYTEGDTSGARIWFERGSNGGKAQLGLFYCKDLVGGMASKFPRDYVKARALLELANHNVLENGPDFIDEGEIGRGIEELGQLYEKGLGGPTDYGKAKRCYEHVSDWNDESMNDLGRLYMNGTGVPRDYNQASQWFRKSIEKSDTTKAPNTAAMVNLGSLYEKGWGVKQSSQQAGYWYQKAADKGNPAAKRKLHEME